MGKLLKHTQCPECAKAGRDVSADNLAVYDDGVFCFSCGYTTREQDSNFKYGDIKSIESRSLTKEALGKYNVQIFNHTGHLSSRSDSYVYDDTCVIFNFYDQGKIVKQKVRSLEDKKKCSQFGNSKQQLLFGQQAFTPTKKIPIIITEGEFDAVAVYQAMNYPAVSIGGAQGAAKHIASNLEWLSGWAYVVLCFDSDDAGKKAVDQCLGLFEVGKVRVAHLPLKDANEMVKAGREEELKRYVWNAEIIKPSTIVGIEDLYERVKEKPQMGRPWPYEFLNKATYGIKPGELYVLAGAEATGKTLLTQEILFHLLNKDVHCGLFSFEQDPASTLQRLIGTKLNKQLHLPGCNDWNEEKLLKELETFKDKLYLYDNKGALTLDAILLNIRYIVKCYGVEFIIIDNMTALATNPMIDGRMVGDVAFMPHATMMLHSLCKELKISMLLISHVKNDTLAKSTYVSTSQKDKENYMDFTVDEMNDLLNKPGFTWESGKMPSSEHIYAGGAMRKIADYVIALGRNKISHDDYERKTLRVRFLKCRLDSMYEGKTFKLHYNSSTGRLEETEDITITSSEHQNNDDII